MDGDAALIKCLMQHPMEPGTRKDTKTGQLIPAHFITEVTATVGGKSVLSAQWGGGIAANPLLAFRVKGAKAGDKVAIKWVDNKGNSESGEAAVG
jgi:sulfur-oxidizing protein SoxZ